MSTQLTLGPFDLNDIENEPSDEKLQSLLDETATCLADELPAGSRLIVFGSQARADARPDSDIDVLVIEPEVINRFAEMARLSQVLGQRLIPADVVVMSQATFEQQKTIINTLAWRADQEGMSLEYPA